MDGGWVVGVGKGLSGIVVCARAQGSDCVFCAGRGLEERDGRWGGKTQTRI